MDDGIRQLLAKARDAYDRREHLRAEPVLRELLRHSDGFADVHNMLAVILHERGDLVAAERHFERAVDLNPNYTDALLNLAVTYNDLGKYEAARQVYARVREGGSGDGGIEPYARGKIANMHAELSQAYLEAGDPREAVAQLKKAVELCPTFADLQVRLGSVYRDLGQMPLAREHFAAARNANPRLVPARILLGVSLLALGLPDQAVAEWREALALDPDNRSAKMYLRMLEAQRARASLTPPPLPPASGVVDEVAADPPAVDLAAAKNA